MAVHRLFDHLGHPVSLGKELGKGGEGSVFEVANSPDSVAKVYHQPLPGFKQEKLRAMTGTKRKELLDVAAWPTGTLHQGTGGPICGFLMRKINSYKDVHFLYSPAHRKVTFPHADWRFLAHTAMNCAAAFDTLHSFGVVVGDVNQSNVFVSADAMAAWYIRDSFQIATNGQTYPCEVGVDLFTPELQGRNFRGVVRTANHDNFGLAVLIFYLLFVGRHPFAGRFLGAGEMPITQAISQHRFAFSRLATSYQMQSPPHAPTIDFVSPELGDLFELAFGAKSTQSKGRPTAKQWVSALGSFKASLRACKSPGHYYPPHLSGCPWCELMGHGRHRLLRFGRICSKWRSAWSRHVRLSCSLGAGLTRFGGQTRSTPGRPCLRLRGRCRGHRGWAKSCRQCPYRRQSLGRRRECPEQSCKWNRLFHQSLVRRQFWRHPRRHQQSRSDGRRLKDTVLEEVVTRSRSAFWLCRPEWCHVCYCSLPARSLSEDAPAPARSCFSSH